MTYLDPAGRPTHSDWDAVVIGSGLGGLTTAAYLTTSGLRTLVLEQWEVAGGCSHVFRRKRDFEFDVGLHYIGDCGEHGAIPTILRGLGAGGKVNFLEMDPDGFDTLVFPGLTFAVPRGWDRYLDRLIEVLPDEEVGLRRCVGILQQISRELATGSRVAPSTNAELQCYLRDYPTAASWGLRTLNELFEECRLSEQARGIIAGQSGDHGTPPSRVSVAVHAGLMHHYIDGGAFYPQGGGQVLAGHLVEVIESHGGAIWTSARVEKILIERGRACGVGLSDGNELRSDIVVSNADIKRTLLELVGPKRLNPHTVAQVESYRMALPLFSVYLGLDFDLADHIPNTNYWCHPSFDGELAYQRCRDDRWPDELRPEDYFAYITSASVKDPHSTHLAPAGHSGIEIMTLVPPDYTFWGVCEGPAAGERYRRKERYRSVKSRIVKDLIDRADMVIPGLREHVVFQEGATPITQERYTLSSGGGCYGIDFAPDQVGPNRPGPTTEIPGLYLAGASTVWGHGIAGVMRGGVGTASAILGRDLFADIQAGKVLGDPARLTAAKPGWDALTACRNLPKGRRRRRASHPAA